MKRIHSKAAYGTSSTALLQTWQSLLRTASWPCPKSPRQLQSWGTVPAAPPPSSSWCPCSTGRARKASCARTPAGDGCLAPAARRSSPADRSSDRRAVSREISTIMASTAAAADDHAKTRARKRARKQGPSTTGPPRYKGSKGKKGHRGRRGRRGRKGRKDKKRLTFFPAPKQNRGKNLLLEAVTKKYQKTLRPSSGPHIVPKIGLKVVPEASTDLSISLLNVFFCALPCVYLSPPLLPVSCCTSVSLSVVSSPPPLSLSLSQYLCVLVACV